MPEHDNFAFLDQFPLNNERLGKIKELTKDTNFRCLLLNLIIAQASKNPTTETEYINAFSEIKATVKLLTISLKSEKI